MQVNETGSKDEASINFRPSPNFKHMKKYLKSKFEEDMNSSNMTADAKDLCKNAVKNKINAAVQPPLPPNSPPPDSPVELGFKLKKEIIDDEYETSPAVDGGEEAPADDQPATAAAAAGADDGTDKKKPIMCKDFVRKTCKRGAACIYAHELDIEQLKGVYRFCRDFENDRCDRQVCYFVHATTFEKEHFFRTGDLPAHALAHLKNNGPQPAGTDVQPDSASLYTSPSVSVAPVISCVPAAAMEPRLAVAPELFPAPADPTAAAEPIPPPAAPVPAAAHAAADPTAAAPLTMSLKREWRDDFGSPPQDTDCKEPFAKKCAHCKLYEIRLQHTKAKVASELCSIQELDRRLEALQAKSQRLHSSIRVLLKPRRTLEMANSRLLRSARLRGLSAAAHPAPPAPLAPAGRDYVHSQVKLFLAKMILAGAAGDSLAKDWDFNAAA